MFRRKAMKRSQRVFDEGPDVEKEREPGGWRSNYMCIRRRRGARCEG